MAAQLASQEVRYRDGIRDLCEQPHEGRGEAVVLTRRSIGRPVIDADRVPVVEELTQLFEHYGLVRKRERVVPEKHGRRLWAAVFARR